MKKQSLKIDIVESFRKIQSFSQSIIESETDILKDERLAVIIYFAAVEDVLNYLIKKICKHGSKLSDENRYFMNKVYILDELGVIDNKTFNNLTNLKELRDKVAHNPGEELEWKNKFTFDKNSTIYKESVKLFGKPEGLFNRLCFVWNTFLFTAIETIQKKELGKIADEQKKLAKNNK